jgi:ectoine hydroxylase-related dioxygenase (phytanoyl-CoA dioxygenase family)
MPRLNCDTADNLELTVDQVRAFGDHGYLGLNAIATQDDIVGIRAIIEKLFANRIGENEGAFGELAAGAQPNQTTSLQILNPVNYAPNLHKTKCFRNALHIAKQLLGHEARFFLDLSILKGPRVGAGTPWHQDAAFRDPCFEYNELAIWVPLQDVTEASGCLQFIPGSHKNSVLEHRPVGNDTNSEALQCIGSFDQDAAVAYPLPVGGCTIHHPGTLHCAGPNTSDVPRFAYIMVFGVAPKPAKEPRTFPWLSHRETPSKALKRRWMRRGGLFITAWRRVRRGDLSSWQSVSYWTRRSIQTVYKGG